MFQKTHKGAVIRGSIGRWVVLLLAFVFFLSLWVFNNQSVLATLFGNRVLAENVEPPVSWRTLNSTKLGISILYPPNFVVDSSYVYTQLSPRAGINGVKFTIPESDAKGTNLSHFDTGVSVEVLPRETACIGTSFVEGSLASDTLTERGVTYAVVKTAGAGVGNFYEETVYVIVGSVPCTAVRYFLHSTNIQNYEPGTIVAFNKPELLKEFDMIRRSLILTH
ncbi:MAG: hypothetical protein V4449_01540 [Patescibacteria group bacterium]